MKILLIRNFQPDGQYSMLKFADCVAGGLRSEGEEIEVLSPKLLFGRLAGTYRYSGISKWLGYVDKFILFPRKLQQRINALQASHPHVVVHVLDHGNAGYVPRQSSCPWLVTCNDLLAVKAARGLGNDVAISRTGRILQKNVFNGLTRANHVACISAATRQDLLHLLPNHSSSSSVIWMGLNHAYQKRSSTEIQACHNQLVANKAWRRIDGQSRTDPPTRFALHVGSNHRRKNREGVLRTSAIAMSSGWDGHVVLAGERPDQALINLATELNITDRFWWIENPHNAELEFLYNRAVALLFPSFAEGFGWPVIEAQACGCPVITSNTTSLPEVAGEAGLTFSPTDFDGMAAALQALGNSSYRETIIQCGFKNARRFSTSGMIENYRSLYRSLTGIGQK